MTLSGRSDVNGSSPLARGTRWGWDPGLAAVRFIPARAGNTAPTATSPSTSPVHPRSRGEHVQHAVVGGSIGGSSPLARGTPAVHPRRGPARRFIPARAGNTRSGTGGPMQRSVHPRSRGEHICHTTSTAAYPWFIPARAGNTPRRPRPCAPRTVHPRSRGEHPDFMRGMCTTAGSSPLARGTPPRGAPSVLGGRFIPARAGNTSDVSLYRCSGAVHPRSRGEHMASPITTPTATGSSPLARGTRDDGEGADARLRFIPARAGNTMRGSGAHRDDHGSSPLARGTHPPRPDRGPHPRFIPARAGNTSVGCSKSPKTTVHPRSRGEHDGTRRSNDQIIGSSPLARGTPRTFGNSSISRRFIPARAGNTAGHVARVRGWPVHPRSRGEHSTIPLLVASASGSSPLARGTRASRLAARRRLRFIPARAGNTSSLRPSESSTPVHPRSRGEHEDPVDHD